MRFVLLVLAALIIPACGSSDSGFTEPPPAPILPVAIVPEPMKVQFGKVGVLLDGSKSYDPVAGAPPLTYLWEHLSGPAPVSPSSATAPTLTFTAPAIKGDMVFRLTVTGAQGTNSATVTVTVKTFIVTAPDSWFVGYGLSVPFDITPSVSGTVASPAYLWTGLEPWLSVGSLTTLPLTIKSTPSLSDFQNFPDRASVLVMERTTQGRLQLKVRVTDGGSTEFDEEYINFSVGPFADSVANENVALGEPVFLNGGATIPKTGNVAAGPVTTWTWKVFRPDGSQAALKLPNKAALSTLDKQFIYFVPDQLGEYKVQLIQNNGLANETLKDFSVICGKYVGVGNLTGTVPDPFVGECASCHAGQFGWLADFANPWKETHHAKVFTEILDPANPLYTASQSKKLWNDFFNFGSEFSIDSRTVGWSRPGATANGGWADKATTEGCVLLGTEWDELVRKHPKTAGKSNVQCESCHGPGSEHAGDSASIRKSYDSLVCGRCHSSRQDLWEFSAHGSTTSSAFTSASGNTSCNGCHTAQGFVVEMRAQETSDPHPVLLGVGNIARPVLPLDDRRSITCQACHEPHKKTVGRPAQPGADPQLRAYGNVKFRNDVVGFGGEAAVCYMCHQSRRDSRTNSSDWNVRRTPHDSTAAEMLAATNAMQFSDWPSYASSPHADRSRFIVAGKPEARQCLTCHNDVTPSKGQTGYLALGGHSFKMAQGDGSATINDATFGAATTTASTRQFLLSAAPGTQTLLKKAFTGDILFLSGGSDPGSYVVDSVDGARQITVKAAGAFTSFVGTTPPTNWTLTSVPKYNTAACLQCHTTGAAFENQARADYDGDGNVEDVQLEIEGLKTLLFNAIVTKASYMVGKAANPAADPVVPIPVTVTTNSTAKYTIVASGLVRTFPGPGITSENPDISYASLATGDQKIWDALYAAAYNYTFVTNDGSGGIHNTGYAVNLLQSAYKAVTGLTLPPFVPF